MLKKELELEKALKAAYAQLEQTYRIPNLEQAVSGLERIRKKQGDKEVDYLIQHPQANQLILQLYKLHPIFWELEGVLKGLLFHHEQKSIAEIKDDLDTLAANIEGLQELLPGLKNYATASDGVKKLLRDFPLLPTGFEATMAHKTLKHVYQYKKEFETCTGTTIESSVTAIQQGFQQLLRINAACIRARVRTRFLSHLEMANMAISQLSSEQKNFFKSGSFIQLKPIDRGKVCSGSICFL